MSPILTRPVREQLEHDRVIRQLQGRYKRKNEVIINPGNEQNQAVLVGDLVVYPDLLLVAEGGKKLLGTVEVETGESVNTLEARAEWAVFCKLKVPLHLYVPPTSVDTARRLCAEYAIPVAEIWTFHITYDQVRFTMIHRSPDAPVTKGINLPSPKPVAKPSPIEATPPPVLLRPPAAPVATPVAKPAAKPVAKLVAKLVAKPAPKPAPKSAAKPAAKPKPATKSKPPANARPVVKAKGKPAVKAKVPKPAAKKAPLRQSSGGQARKAKPAKKRR